MCLTRSDELIIDKGFYMDGLPFCPKCKCEYTYENGSLFVCTECDHEWSASPVVPVDEKRVWKDAFGNELKDGDAVQVIKDLKVKGSSSSVKVGTKVKNIRLIDSDHDISCKIEGFGLIQIKSEFVKKA